jgi:hypothetical protein
MRANRRVFDLSRPLNVIASGTGTAVFRITRINPRAQVGADDPEGAEPVESQTPVRAALRPSETR